MRKMFDITDLFKKFVFAIAFFTIHDFRAAAHCKTALQFAESLSRVEKDFTLSNRQKLFSVISLKKEFENCKLNKDSIYAKILHRLGALQFSNGEFNEGINTTIQSININISGRKECSRRNVINSYFNLGYCFQQLHFYQNALKNYDNCISIGREYRELSIIDRVVRARIKKGSIYYATGDFQKDIEETSLGLAEANLLKDSSLVVDLLNERSQAYISLGRIDEALMDISKASTFIKKTDYTAIANNFQLRAEIAVKNKDYKRAIFYHKEIIINRSRTYDTVALAGDLNNAGNTLREAQLYSEAKDYLKRSLVLAKKIGNNVIAGKASSNLGLVNLRLQNYPLALEGYHTSLLNTVTAFKNNNLLNNPAYLQCNSIGDKTFLSVLLANKAECLLHLYKQSGNKAYLTSALKTALLTDSIITDVRREQASEQSKLYWRQETREFFSNAIEISYQAKDEKLAFYFMEKSRAVLLNDKLNELGAFAYLPPEEARKEQSMQIKVLALQQQIAQLSENDREYEERQVKLIQTKDELDRYIKTLQDKYPVYYQYKYADDVPQLSSLQKYLYNNKQTFVHYFINDTAIYMLAITPHSSKLIKLNSQNFNSKLLDFLRTCSNKQALNNDYASFASLSHNIYETIFKPLSLSAGRVIICYDNYLAPFEALATDVNGKNFLVNNYVFSYVYSARFLLKNFNNPRGKGDFLGVAPVSYAGYLHVPQLSQSSTSLNATASYFPGFELITNNQANRSNLLALLPRYTVVTILSHARADSTDKEPMLFMADSVIRLSELQLLRNPSTQLIVLSACQTNVGKIATGEGIISLARGFSSAGIPAISATLWKADEQAIYNITEAFLKNIAKGMRKDDALQKAKLDFMKNGSKEKLLPFYWANMILAGNGQPLNLTNENSLTSHIVGVIGITAILILIIIAHRRKKVRL